MSFVKYITNAYEDKDVLSKLLNYCVNDLDYYGEKTQEVISATYNLSPLSKEYLMNDFNKLKEITHQEHGRQLIHLVVSIFKNNIGESIQETSARLVMDTIGQWILASGYQSVAFIHIKESGNVHIHLIINNISYITGNRLTNIHGYLTNLTNLLRYQYSYLCWENPKYGNR